MPDIQLEQCDTAELYDTYAARAFRYARAMGLPAADADDVVSESFLRVLKSRGDFRGEADFATWLLRIVRNAVIDMVRGESRRRTRQDAVGEQMAARTHPPADGAAQRRETHELVQRALSDLDPEQREALSLVTAGELSYRQAAEAVGVSVSALTARVYRARQAVRDALVKRGVMGM